LQTAIFGVWHTRQGLRNRGMMKLTYVCHICVGQKKQISGSLF